MLQADVRLSLTSEASMGAPLGTAGEQGVSAYVGTFLKTSLPQPLDAGAFSTGGLLPPCTCLAPPTLAHHHV